MHVCFIDRARAVWLVENLSHTVVAWTMAVSQSELTTLCVFTLWCNCRMRPFDWFMLLLYWSQARQYDYSGYIKHQIVLVYHYYTSFCLCQMQKFLFVPQNVCCRHIRWLMPTNKKDWVTVHEPVQAMRRMHFIIRIFLLDRIDDNLFTRN